MKFRKKPVVIEAIQWTGANRTEIRAFCPNLMITLVGNVLIITHEGTMTGNLGDWIVRGTAGEFYPCKPDIFAEVHEAIGDEE